MSVKQTGFVKDCGTEVNLTRINHIRHVEFVEKKEEKHLWLVFIDLAKAYDCVDFEISVKKLEKVLKKEELELYKALHRNVRVKLGKEKIICSKNGVITGDVSSPLVFNVMIEDLIGELESIEGVEAFLYADDVVAMTYDEKKVKEIIKKAKGWSSENNLPINKKKSAVMRIIKKKSKKDKFKKKKI